MRRTAFTLLIAVAVYWVGTPAMADCTSVAAQCAVQAGGQCDQATGRWCYGVSGGRNCGGSPAAFRSCMTQHGVQVYRSQVPREIGAVATTSSPGKCTSVQAQCAIEIGGTCDATTGSWCYGYTYGHGRNCGGGGTAAFDACVSRKRGANR
jgi:hypothetical protein